MVMGGDSWFVYIGFESHCILDLKESLVNS